MSPLLILFGVFIFGVMAFAVLTLQAVGLLQLHSSIEALLSIVIVSGILALIGMKVIFRG